MLTGNAKGLLSVTDAILDRPIEEILLSLPISRQIRTALCGGARRFRDIYDALLDYERADWPALAAAAARLGPIESLIPDCYTSRHRARRHARLLAIRHSLLVVRGRGFAPPGVTLKHNVSARSPPSTLLPSSFQKKRRGESFRRAGK